MKTKIHKILGVALALVLVFSLAGAFMPVNRVEAQAYTPNQWNTLSTPSPGGLILNTGSNVTDFAVGPDGTTVYVVNGPGAKVAKSTIGGAAFSNLTLPTTLTAPKLVAVAPDNPDAIAVVDGDEEVFVSSNGGASWASLGVPAANQVISDIAVSPARTGTMLGRDYAVSTYGTTGWGDIYVIGGTATWAAVATGAGVNLDFTSLALAPNWAGDRVVVAVGSDTTPGGNSEIGGAALGDSWLVAINVATGALAGPGRVRLDAAASDSPAAFTCATLGAGVTWDATQKLSGSYSALLTASGEYVEFIPAQGTKFSDLATITGSFWYYTTATIGPGLELRFTGPNFNSTTGAEHIDITVNTAELAPTNNGCLESVSSTSTATCYGNDLNATGATDYFFDGTWGPGVSTGGLSLANLVTAVDTLYQSANWDGSDPADWTLTRVRAEIYGASNVYIDDITIAGNTYGLEPSGTAGQVFSSSITLPSDFDSTSVGNFRAYVGWTSVKSAGNIILCADDAYRVDFNAVRKLEVRPTVAIQSLSYFGTIGAGTLMAGEAATTGVWFSSDPMSGMPSWGAGSAKAPTGATNTIVAMTSETDAFAGTSGTNSGFHKSVDGGLSFNGLSFIDEAIAAMTDVMLSPDGSTVFLATADAVTAGNDSLWRGVGFPSPGRWQRVHFRDNTATQFPGASTLIRLSPDYATDSTLYWVDTGTGAGTVIRRSTDAGQMWGGRTAPQVVADATIESQNVLYIINGSNVYASTNGGWFFGLPTDAGKGALYSIAMAPTYPAKPIAGNVLVGSGTGAALSTNSASSFKSLKSVGGASKFQVVADEDFAVNSIVYGASNTAGQGIWRFTVGTSSAWEQIRGVAGQMTGLAQKDGVLFGSWTGAGAAPTTIYSEPIQAVVTIALTGDTDLLPEAFTLTYVNQGTVSATAPATLIPYNAALGATFPITLATGDTGVMDITNATGISIDLTTGEVDIVGTQTGNVYATIEFANTTGFTDGTIPTWPVTVGAVTGAASGVERSLMPTVPSYAAGFWDSMTVGATAATFTAAPSALRVAGNGSISLWAINIAATKLMAYQDEMALAQSTVTVPDTVPFDSVSGGNAEFTISWTNLSNATLWELEIGTDPGCTQRVVHVTNYFPPFPLGPTYVVGPNTLVAGTDYFVHVRATDEMPGDAIRSQWSSVQRFSVQAGERVTVSYLGVQPLGPVPGAIDVPLSPGFTWSPYASSTRYEFQLATDAGFSDILAEAKLAATGYKYDGKLSTATTYFWRARGIEPTVTSWSPVSSFTTEKAPPAPPAPPAAPPTPAAPAVTSAVIWAIIAIGAILVIAVIVLIVRTRRVV